MHSLRGSRRLARLVAAWLLLWFAAMQGTALLRAPSGRAAVAVSAGLADAPGDETHQAHQSHQGHDAHAAPAGPADHAAGGEHSGADHVVQCPGCLFSTAPPPQEFSAAQAEHALGQPPAFPAHPAPRAHALPEPPARGPPPVS